jgi:hypothetical protein
MKTSNAYLEKGQLVKKSASVELLSRSTKPCSLIWAFLFFYSVGLAQGKSCRECSIPGFESVTLYYVAQPHSNVGFGMEAGHWNKEESRFSYFLGAKMQWFQWDPNSDKYSNRAENIHFAVYLKGQFQIIDRFYFVASPQLLNLTSFELGLGARYVYPISDVIGIGLEPTYSIMQKECSLNLNVHFAL